MPASKVRAESTQHRQKKKAVAVIAQHAPAKKENQSMFISEY
jgi:hypothetical protein